MLASGRRKENKLIADNRPKALCVREVREDGPHADQTRWCAVGTSPRLQRGQCVGGADLSNNTGFGAPLSIGFYKDEFIRGENLEAERLQLHARSLHRRRTAASQHRFPTKGPVWHVAPTRRRLRRG